MGSLASLRLKPHGINPVGVSQRKTSEHIPLEMETDVGRASRPEHSARSASSVFVTTTQRGNLLADLAKVRFCLKKRDTGN
jgi:hypothetical protein